MGDKEVILNLNRRRFKCKTCRKTFSEQFDFIGTKKGFTHRYAENIVKQVISSNVSNVARNNGLTEEEINIRRQPDGTELNQDYSIGLDGFETVIEITKKS